MRDNDITATILTNLCGDSLSNYIMDDLGLDYETIEFVEAKCEVGKYGDVMRKCVFKVVGIYNDDIFYTVVAKIYGILIYSMDGTQLKLIKMN